jgi:electron transport complex protein RnfC
MTRKLRTFRGGLHLPEHKEQSTSRPILTLPLPQRLILPLRQHAGTLAKPVVSVGERVLKGQVLAEATGVVSAAVHAPTSGTIVELSEHLIPHYSGLADWCLTLEPDGEDAWVEREVVDWASADPEAVRLRLQAAGVVGLGGATFPSHVKLRATPGRKLRKLILNGAECEPYISCDDMLMRERAQGILRGADIMMQLMGASQCLIGIEDNKPQAIAAMETAARASGLNVEVVAVPTLYPGGGAKQLIRVLTGKEVPSHRFSTEFGVQCFNVATAYTMHRALEYGEPVISRIVTVTGGVRAPGNFEALLGTPVADLLAAAGGALPDADNLIMGGPMMGVPLASERMPVVKAMNCIIAATPQIFPAPPPVMPCIRCVRCADVCPINLQPQELYWFSKAKSLDKARDYNVFDCIECGCCDYVCPSHIPLTEYFRFAKSEIVAQDKAKQAADQARERNEFRLLRIEREKQERAARHAQKAVGAKTEAANATAAVDEAAKKAAIAAAMARAQAQKAEVVPQNTEDLPPAVRAEMAEIDARRAQAARVEEQQES